MSSLAESDRQDDLNYASTILRSLCDLATRKGLTVQELMHLAQKHTRQSTLTN